MKDSITQSLPTLEYVDRMLDYARAVHSLPESAAAPGDQMAVYGPDWNRDVCDCGLYPYEHAGCPGPKAKHRPPGWKSGDDVPDERVL